MLEYGFSNYQLFTPVQAGDALEMDIPVQLGVEDAVPAVSGGTYSMLVRKGETDGISLEAALVEKVSAPVRRGDVVGEIRVKQGEETVAVLPAIAGRTVELPGMVGALLRIRDRFMLGGENGF